MLNRVAIGGFSSSKFYWSSSETYPTCIAYDSDDDCISYSYDMAWVQNVYYGYIPGPSPKSNTNKFVRAVRSFAVTMPIASSEATLQASSTVKGQTVQSLGTPVDTLDGILYGNVVPGQVVINTTQALDTSNAGSFITAFKPTDTSATVKVVKYIGGMDPSGFAGAAAYNNESIVAATGFFVVKVTAQDGVTTNYYKINLRETGPAGGYLFYDKGSISNGWRYLEVAPTDQINQIWSNVIGIPGTDIVIGTGQANTTHIINQIDHTTSAAKVCNDLVLNGYSDWFLPSLNELSMIYVNLQSGNDEYGTTYSPVGNFGNHFYWSSSDYHDNDAQCKNLSNGGDTLIDKTSSSYVRCVRAIATVTATPPHTYTVGENYDGGIVAYILQPGDTGYDANVQHGLIAATSNQNAVDVNVAWSNGTFIPVNTTSTAIGSGMANTMAIIAAQGAPISASGYTSYAAYLAHSYNGGGHNDWYLPSKDELNMLYKNRDAIGNFDTFYYWSSSEYSIDPAHYSPTEYAWNKRFNTGATACNLKNDYFPPTSGNSALFTGFHAYNVRAVRSF